uniref:Si:dkeyp-72e1.7 n=1 Tax=Sinocyclocheilus grahami TaxID=75366 RepID=A0A672QCF7_SINGR
MRKSFFKRAKALPWISNVTLYGCLFAGGDFVHQCMIAQREEMDWRHTRNVAIVALSFHGNFNYFWLRALEHRFPGRSASMIFRKLLLDQTFASPLATSVFYTGVSFLEGKEDIFADWREKFFNTYKTRNSLTIRPRLPLYIKVFVYIIYVYVYIYYVYIYIKKFENKKHLLQQKYQKSTEGLGCQILSWIMQGLGIKKVTTEMCFCSKCVYFYISFFSSTFEFLNI